MFDWSVAVLSVINSAFFYYCFMSYGSILISSTLNSEEPLLLNSITYIDYDKLLFAETAYFK